MLAASVWRLGAYRCVTHSVGSLLTSAREFCLTTR
jgi:hypothetical protein